MRFHAGKGTSTDLKAILVATGGDRITECVCFDMVINHISVSGGVAKFGVSSVNVGAFLLGAENKQMGVHVISFSQ
ncbi:hypothetical protein C5167_041826, partial [Papaver somniferum]